ncbi:MAG: tetratricopeptide repeat protein, partial [Syntrophales bacterium]|nr:tetratricopeptide repeat protein [Syntrophales bacterium]
DNCSIRNLSSIFQVFSPPFNTGVAGRPIVNFSLALNYAISGADPWSYHLLNLLIHLSAALCLFGIVRSSFLSDRLKGKYGHAATPLSFACALLWALHPLQTQAVTYVIQRCESLMGLCFLLTFYFAIHGWQSDIPRKWHLAAVLSFLAGIGTKEVIVVAPFLLFVYDLLFFHGDPRNVLRRSPFLYTGLSFGLLSLGLLLAAGGTVSSGTGRITFTALDYWITQPEVILHYLRLAFWPYSLCLDYAWPIAAFRDAWPSLFIVSAFIAASAWAVGKGLPIGFPALWFFAILAPTSLFPLPDAAFEHRMYLPSAALVVIAVIGAYRLLEIISRRFIIVDETRARIVRKGSLYLLVLCSMSFLILTYSRNLDYQTEFAIWVDTVEKRPENSRSQANVGHALIQQEKYYEALIYLKKAVRIEGKTLEQRNRLKSDEYLYARQVYAKTQVNIGLAYLRLNNLSEAGNHLRAALNISPNDLAAHTNMGIVLNLQGKYKEAAYYFKKVLNIEPLNPDGHANLGAALLLSGKPMEAVTHFKEALRLKPEHVKAHYGMGMALRQLGREAEAVIHFRETLRLNPHFGPAKESMEDFMKKQKMGQASS